jgi:hypothetical protein
MSSFFWNWLAPSLKEIVHPFVFFLHHKSAVTMRRSCIHDHPDAKGRIDLSTNPEHRKGRMQQEFKYHIEKRLSRKLLTKQLVGFCKK